MMVVSVITLYSNICCSGFKDGKTKRLKDNSLLSSLGYSDNGRDQWPKQFKVVDNAKLRIFRFRKGWCLYMNENVSE